jgi:hypothetical protein
VRLTTADAEEKCYIDEGVPRYDDLWCRNKVRDKKGAESVKGAQRSEKL